MPSKYVRKRPEERVVHPRAQRGIERRREIVEFVRAYWAANHIPPTLWEIADGLGLASHAGVFRHVRKLVDAGELEMTRGVARSIRLPRKAAGKGAS